MKLYCGNKLAINLTYNLVQHDQTKNIEVGHNFIKNKLCTGLVCNP